MNLDLLAGEFSVVRLPPGSGVPGWTEAASFCSFTRTLEETSIVISDDAVPEGLEVESDWRCLKVSGPLNFEMTGVLAALSCPLSEAGIPIFVLSTYDTDYLMVKSVSLQQALAVLRESGHSVVETPDI
ncbi:MAG: ACT domain-containing protein [bacterium]